jgi:hypothetical protein
MVEGRSSMIYNTEEAMAEQRPRNEWASLKDMGYGKE